MYVHRHHGNASADEVDGGFRHGFFEDRWAAVDPIEAKWPHGCTRGLHKGERGDATSSSDGSDVVINDMFVYELGVNQGGDGKETFSV